MIAGVCGGLGRYTGIDPIVFRIGLAALAVFGGVGLLLYALAWLLVPDDTAAQSEGQRLLQGRGTLAMFAAIVLGVLGVLALVDLFHRNAPGPIAVVLILGALVVIVANRRNGGAPATPGAQAAMGGFVGPAGSPGGYPPSPPPGPAAFAPGPPGFGPSTTMPLGPPAGFGPSRPTYTPPVPPPPRPPRQPSMLGPLALSLGVVVTGTLFALDAARAIDITAQAVFAAALLTIGLALVIGTWIGRARALIAVGVVMTCALVVTAALDVPLRGGIGDRVDTPTTVGQLKSEYHLGIGQQLLDLRTLQLQGKTVHIVSSVGLGHLIVQVPTNVAVTVHGRAGVGELLLFDVHTNGTQLNRAVSAPVSDPRVPGEIDLDLRVGAGQVEVVQLPQYEVPVPTAPPAPESPPAAESPPAPALVVPVPPPVAVPIPAPAASPAALPAPGDVHHYETVGQL
ncbi:MAG: hypothetical protein QOJ62_2780 [Actinomycetota bacterium]|jgi:phage shock protein PspC (stress-responsive transcriptional regulator)/predicted membrane protein|nr:hypothetical protein [Actinomycetota bacterium]